MLGASRARRRLFTVVVVLVVAVVLVQSGLFVGGNDQPAPTKGPTDVKIVDLGGDTDARLWPYTSRQKTFESLTLPINVVVRGDAARVRSILASRQDATFDRTTNEWQGIGPEATRRVTAGDDPEWNDATGATRYTYLVGAGSADGWMDETMQLHSGTYFGSRTHLRLYGTGSGDNAVTAVQAHRDYWDWFRLRHTVSSLKGSQTAVERAFVGTGTVADISRERYANGGIKDTDGWVTVVDLRPPRTPTTEATAGGTMAMAVLVASVVAGGRSRLERLAERVRWSRLADRRVQRLGLLAAALAVLPVAVRTGGIALESIVPRQPKLVAALLYPVFAFVPPVLAVRLPVAYRSDYWFAAAFVGYGVGLVVDFASIGVGLVSVPLVVHRFTVLVTVGALAVGGGLRARDGQPTASRRLVVGGACLWVVLLGWPLFVGLT